MTASAVASRDRAALALLCAAIFMMVLDGVIINVALDDIFVDLGLSHTALQWVVNAYILTFGGFLLMGGRAADVFGRRRIFIIGILLFTSASLAGGLAGNGAFLVTARCAQGLGAAFTSPAALSLVGALFPQGPRRARAYGAIGMVAAFGAASGVLLGGLLTGTFGWRSVLLINLPIGLAIAALAPRLIAERERGKRSKGPIDTAGAISITGALVLFVYAIVEIGDRQAISGVSLVAAGASAICLTLFVLIERRAAAPLLRAELLANRGLLGANIVALFHTTGALTTLYFLSLHFQQRLGYSPELTGISFLPFAIMAAVGARLAARLIAAIGPFRLMPLGLLTMSAGLAYLSRLPAPGNFWLDYLPGLLIVGVAVTLTSVPMTMAAISSVEDRDMGMASGLVSTSQQVGAAIALGTLVAATAGSGEEANFRPAFAIASLAILVGAVISWAFLRGMRGSLGAGAAVDQD
jgi:EmrB/QacA subfamily drug resistance transporter